MVFPTWKAYTPLLGTLAVSSPPAPSILVMIVPLVGSITQPLLVTIKPLMPLVSPVGRQPGVEIVFSTARVLALIRSIWPSALSGVLGTACQKWPADAQSGCSMPPAPGYSIVPTIESGWILTIETYG